MIFAHYIYVECRVYVQYLEYAGYHQLYTTPDITHITSYIYNIYIIYKHIIYTHHILYKYKLYLYMPISLHIVFLIFYITL